MRGPGIEEALLRLDEERKSESTKRIWRTVLEDFEHSYELTDEGILQWIRDLRSKGIKESTIRTYVKSLKRYCRIYNIDINWEYSFPRQPKKDFDPDILTREEVVKILEESPEKKEVMFRTAYECVTRPKELCNILKNDVNLDKNLITIYGLKGSATFDNPITNELKQMIIRYIEINNTRDGEFLFKTTHGNRWNSNYLSSKVFKKICKKAIGREVRMIDFSRHSRITHLLQDGNLSPYPVPDDEKGEINLYYVIRLARHKNMNQTLRYAHVAGEEVQSRLQNYIN